MASVKTIPELVAEIHFVVKNGGPLNSHIRLASLEKRDVAFICELFITGIMLRSEANEKADATLQRMIDELQSVR